MIVGLIHKTLRENVLPLAIFAIALTTAEGLFAYALPTFLQQAGGDQLLQIRFIRNIMQALLGTEIGESIGAHAPASMAWVHPLILALLWAQIMTFCTRMPAAEIDRGTIDILLALPVSRLRLYACEGVAFLLVGGLLVLLMLVGNTFGGRFVDPQFRAEPTALLPVVANLYCVYVAVGGVVWLISAFSSRRGRAIGVALGVMLVSMFLNFLSPFWSGAKVVSFLSILEYYRPLEILRTQAWPWNHMLILASIGILSWVGGALVFRKRNICTV